MSSPKCLLIDNYDSFSYNLVQYLVELKSDVIVKRHDDITISDIRSLDPTHLLISPGPGNPSDAGLSCAAIEHFAGTYPILGVCLGHQCIASVFGGKIKHAQKTMHGKVSMIHHDGSGVLTGITNPFSATRYHSLVVDKTSLPNCFEITAWTNEGEIMGLRHKIFPVEGVQFHPEALLTEHGHTLLNTFLRSQT